MHLTNEVNYIYPPDSVMVRPVVYEASEVERNSVQNPINGRLEDQSEFFLSDFVAEVVARHPSVQAMEAGWLELAQRYPQVIIPDDPMFMAMTAPESLNSATTEGAYTLELRQKVLWRSKRDLRGEAALEEAAAAGHEVDEARLKLTLVAQLAYLDYYLADQQLELNDRTIQLMKGFRESASVRYQTNLVTQQDVLQADVELAELARRKLELTRMKRVAASTINSLLLRPSESPLPMPQLQPASVSMINDSELLYQWALENRPDLAALRHRVDMEATNLQLAYKQYYPDLEVFGRYDTFWQPSSTQGPLRAQIGISTNLPVFRRKLNAGVCEAQFRLQRQRAEYDQLANQIQREVQTTLEQVRESEQAIDLYEDELLPAAKQYLEAARSNYEVGKATFLDVVQAQRQLVLANESQIQAHAMLAQRKLELERNLGGSLPVDSKPDTK